MVLGLEAEGRRRIRSARVPNVLHMRRAEISYVFNQEKDFAIGQQPARAESRDYD
jgi:hypothetical protein